MSAGRVSAAANRARDHDGNHVAARSPDRGSARPPVPRGVEREHARKAGPTEAREAVRRHSARPCRCPRRRGSSARERERHRVHALAHQRSLLAQRERPRQAHPLTEPRLRSWPPIRSRDAAPRRPCARDQRRPAASRSTTARRTDGAGPPRRCRPARARRRPSPTRGSARRSAGRRHRPPSRRRRTRTRSSSARSSASIAWVSSSSTAVPEAEAAPGRPAESRWAMITISRSERPRSLPMTFDSSCSSPSTSVKNRCREVSRPRLRNRVSTTSASPTSPGLPARRSGNRCVNCAAVREGVRAAERVRRQIGRMRRRARAEREHGDDQRQQGGHERRPVDARIDHRCGSV